jgi:ketosteroid isomerase-like protein
VGPLDLDRFVSAVAPAVEYVDHRRLIGLGSKHGVREFRDALRTLFDAADDVTNRVDEVYALRSDAHLLGMTNAGREHVGGGTYERPFVALFVLGTDGLATHVEQFDVGDEAAALARFDELTAKPPALATRIAARRRVRANAATANAARLDPAIGGRPDAVHDPLAALAKPNAATAARDSVEAAFAKGDWAAMRALCVADATFEDRRRHILVSHGVNGWIADRQRWARSAVHQERRLVSTAGDRVALERILTTSGPPDRRSEFEYLVLTEVDERGRIVVTVAFDLNDSRAANREALARVSAGDPVAAASLGPLVEVLEAFNDRDRARLRAVFADDVVAEDRRRTGVGRIEDASSYVDSLSVFWDLAPDGQADTVHILACERHGVTSAGRVLGTLAEGGGAFETYFINVLIAERGRITRYELFEPEDVDAALARFAELRPDPLGVPANSATRAMERARGLIRARDWEACRALASSDFAYEDRRKYAHVTGGVEVWIRSMEEVASWPGVGVTDALLGTAGDRIMVEREVFSGAPDAGAFEIEVIRLIEFGADGRLVAWINFDVEDRSAALAEAHARLVAGEAGIVGGGRA